MELANNLLRALRPSDRKFLDDDLEKISLPRGAVLFEPGDAVRTILFPCDSTIVALVVSMRDGMISEVATVGREGAIGGIVSHGYVPAFTRAVVQIPGPALRMDVARLNAAKERSPSLANLFTRYADCFLAQLLQSVGCNALHPIEQRAARWLLETQDRVGDELPLTQEFLAEMLGVQRTYVTRVARSLQRAGLIQYHRGRITILDRERLEKSACECHAAVRTHFQRVLAGVYPNRETGNPTG